MGRTFGFGATWTWALATIAAPLSCVGVLGCSGAFSAAGTSSEGEPPPTDPVTSLPGDPGDPQDPGEPVGRDAGSVDSAPPIDAADAGRTFRWAFVSKGKTSGAIQTGFLTPKQGLEAADAICTSEGKVLAPGKVFRALLHSGSQRPWDRVAPTSPKPYAMPSGTGPVQVLSGPGAAPAVAFDRTAEGSKLSTFLSSETAWTGADTGGNCRGWTATTSTDTSFGNVGSLTKWLSAGSGTCVEERHVYCFEVD
jgi:hypothetical protein